MNDDDKTYKHALRYAFLTRVYDPLTALTCREKTFKTALLEQARLSPDMSVLDLGSGTGTLTIMAKSACPTAQVIGLDGDEQVIEMARRKAAEAGVDITFDRGLSSDMPYPDNRFDIVLASLLFHHLSTQDKEATLAEVLRVLRPGGELHVADWGEPSNRLLRLGFYVVQVLDGFDTTADNVAGRIPELIRDAGFARVSEPRRIPTALGSISLYAAGKAGS